MKRCEEKCVDEVSEVRLVLFLLSLYNEEDSRRESLYHNGLFSSVMIDD